MNYDIILNDKYFKTIKSDHLLDIKVRDIIFMGVEKFVVKSFNFDLLKECFIVKIEKTK